MNRLVLGSIPVLGSSNNTTCGLPNNAIAKHNFRLVPPDIAFARLSPCSRIPRASRKLWKLYGYGYY